MPLPRSHPKTLLIFTTILDAGAMVDHRTTQALPSYLGTQHVRELSLWGARNIPVDIGCFPAHPGVCPQALGFPWKVNFRGR